MLQHFTPERVIIFYLDTLNRVGVFFSDDFSFPLRRLLEAYLRWFMSQKKKKSWPNCCGDRETNSASVPLRCFQRWQRLWEDNTAQHGCPEPDQRGDNQSQSKSYSGKLFYMFASPRPTWTGVLPSTQLFPSPISPHLGPTQALLFFSAWALDRRARHKSFEAK